MKKLIQLKNCENARSSGSLQNKILTQKALMMSLIERAHCNFTVIRTQYKSRAAQRYLKRDQAKNKNHASGGEDKLKENQDKKGNLVTDLIARSKTAQKAHNEKQLLKGYLKSLAEDRDESESELGSSDISLSGNSFRDLIFIPNLEKGRENELDSNFELALKKASKELDKVLGDSGVDSLDDKQQRNLLENFLGKFVNLWTAEAENKAVKVKRDILFVNKLAYGITLLRVSSFWSELREFLGDSSTNGLRTILLAAESMNATPTESADSKDPKNSLLNNQLVLEGVLELLDDLFSASPNPRPLATQLLEDHSGLIYQLLWQQKWPSLTLLNMFLRLIEDIILSLVIENQGEELSEEYTRVITESNHSLLTQLNHSKVIPPKAKSPPFKEDYLTAPVPSPPKDSNKRKKMLVFESSEDEMRETTITENQKKKKALKFESSEDEPDNPFKMKTSNRRRRRIGMELFEVGVAEDPLKINKTNKIIGIGSSEDEMAENPFKRNKAKKRIGIGSSDEEIPEDSFKIGKSEKIVGFGSSGDEIPNMTFKLNKGRRRVGLESSEDEVPKKPAKLEKKKRVGLGSSDEEEKEDEEEEEEKVQEVGEAKEQEKKTHNYLDYGYWKKLEPVMKPELFFNHNEGYHEFVLNCFSIILSNKYWISGEGKLEEIIQKLQTKEGDEGNETDGKGEQKKEEKLEGKGGEALEEQERDNQGTSSDEEPYFYQDESSDSSEDEYQPRHPQQHENSSNNQGGDQEQQAQATLIQEEHLREADKNEEQTASEDLVDSNWASSDLSEDASPVIPSQPTTSETPLLPSITRLISVILRVYPTTPMKKPDDDKQTPANPLSFSYFLKNESKTEQYLFEKFSDKNDKKSAYSLSQLEYYIEALESSYTKKISRLLIKLRYRNAARMSTAEKLKFIKKIPASDLYLINLEEAIDEDFVLHLLETDTKLDKEKLKVLQIDKIINKIVFQRPDVNYSFEAYKREWSKPKWAQREAHYNRFFDFLLEKLQSPLTDLTELFEKIKSLKQIILMRLKDSSMRINQRIYLRKLKKDHFRGFREDKMFTITDSKLSDLEAQNGDKADKKQDCSPIITYEYHGKEIKAFQERMDSIVIFSGEGNSVKFKEVKKVKRSEAEDIQINQLKEEQEESEEDQIDEDDDQEGVKGMMISEENSDQDKELETEDLDQIARILGGNASPGDQRQNSVNSGMDDDTEVEDRDPAANDTVKIIQKWSYCPYTPKNSGNPKNIEIAEIDDFRSSEEGKDGSKDARNTMDAQVKPLRLEEGFDLSYLCLSPIHLRKGFHLLKKSEQASGPANTPSLRLFTFLPYQQLIFRPFLKSENLALRIRATGTNRKLYIKRSKKIILHSKDMIPGGYMLIKNSLKIEKIDISSAPISLNNPSAVSWLFDDLLIFFKSYTKSSMVSEYFDFSKGIFHPQQKQRVFYFVLNLTKRKLQCLYLDQYLGHRNFGLAQLPVMSEKGVIKIINKSKNLKIVLKKSESGPIYEKIVDVESCFYIGGVLLEPEYSAELTQGIMRPSKFYGKSVSKKYNFELWFRTELSNQFFSSKRSGLGGDSCEQFFKISNKVSQGKFFEASLFIDRKGDSGKGKEKGEYPTFIHVRDLDQGAVLRVELEDGAYVSVDSYQKRVKVLVMDGERLRVKVIGFGWLRKVLNKFIEGNGSRDQ